MIITNLFFSEFNQPYVLVRWAHGLGPSVQRGCKTEKHLEKNVHMSKTLSGQQHERYKAARAQPTDQ